MPEQNDNCASPAALTDAARRLMLAADDVDLGRSIHNERKPDDKIEGPVWDELRRASAAIRALLAAQPPAAAEAMGIIKYDDVVDAERWRTTLRYVAGRYSETGDQRFVLPGLLPVSLNIMQGSVAEHFTNAIDAAMGKEGV